ncbi:hypothetical protein ABGB14_12430 [Nonomuraea sp. B10E15]|uniref:hypothetical protein n=1 Tax=Nonomuraea sp. B10E15 TaxID=3153560 RepID=UPI00325CA159
MKITLPLPRTLTSRFVVAMERTRFDVDAFLPWRVAGPHRKAVISAMRSRALTATYHPTPWKPTGANLGDEERRRLRRAKHHVVVSATAPPHLLPASAQAARAAARALARECDGPLIDPLTGAAILTCGQCAGEPAAFHLNDDWLAWDVRTHEVAACAPWDPGDTSCLRVTSRGLRRFALPEITLDGAACAHNLCATNLLRTVASRLVADHLAHLTAHPEATERRIDDFLQIQPGDQPDGGCPFGVLLTPYEADAVGPAGVRRLKVGPAPGTGQITCLKVGPPLGFTGSTNDWLCATQSTAHASLTSMHPPSSTLAA